MPDSVRNLIDNVLGIIDSMSIKDSVKTVVQVDSNLLRQDTVVINTTFVRDSIFANVIMHTLDSISGKTDSTLITGIDTSESIPTKPKVLYVLSIDTAQVLAMDSAAIAIIAENRAIDSKIFKTGIPVNAIFLPIIFDGQRPENAPQICRHNKKHSHHKPHSINRRKTQIERDKELAAIGEYAQARMIVENPELVHYTPEMLPKAIHMDRVKKRREFLNINNHDMPTLREIHGREIKIKRWISSLQSSIQISQTYVSENWYQGGTSNINLISDQVYRLNYKDPKGNIVFENTAQWKLNIGNAPNDTMRSYNISEDLFRIDSKFGYKAFKQFYYSASIFFKTQVFNHFKRNTKDKESSFLSPGEFSVNIGMTHNYTSKNNELKTSLALSPLSYNLKTCINSQINETRFGIEEGKKTINKIGSSFDATLRWTFMRNMEFHTRLYYFTSYERVQIDWENTLNFILNRYFSTRIEFKMRYDDSVAPNSKGSFIQMKELLSFGLFFRI